MYNSYVENGVILIPNVIAEGHKATIRYNGSLYNSGADNVYMHMGYGDNWNETHDIKMTKTPKGFETEFPISSKEKLNIAFKDSAANWDNNFGKNYSFHVELR